jgi:hypothetical protein
VTGLNSYRISTIGLSFFPFSGFFVSFIENFGAAIGSVLFWPLQLLCWPHI